MADTDSRNTYAAVGGGALDGTARHRVAKIDNRTRLCKGLRAMVGYLGFVRAAEHLQQWFELMPHLGLFRLVVLGLCFAPGALTRGALAQSGDSGAGGSHRSATRLADGVSSGGSRSSLYRNKKNAIPYVPSDLVDARASTARRFNCNDKGVANPASVSGQCYDYTSLTDRTRWRLRDGSTGSVERIFVFHGETLALHVKFDTSDMYKTLFVSPEARRYATLNGYRISGNRAWPVRARQGTLDPFGSRPGEPDAAESRAAQCSRQFMNILDRAKCLSGQSATAPRPRP